MTVFLLPSDNDDDDDDGDSGGRRDISDEAEDEDGDDDADVDRAERDELLASTTREAIPTNKAAFRTHPLYVVPSALRRNEALAPTARLRVCGVFKGELVYRRDDVGVASTARRWPYRGGRVREDEIGRPAKTVKARKKPSPVGFQALATYGAAVDADQVSGRGGFGAVGFEEEEENDGMDKLYGPWQTDAWSPPRVAPDDPILKNRHGNIELDLLNPGLVHLDFRGMASVAKRLGIPVSSYT